jgi:predicted ATP-grasp superfamily ATP-dependent carboligase
MKFDVLLTGAESRQGIVTIRSLARQGIKMMVAGEQRDSIGFYSKFISGHGHSPSPMTEKEKFVEFLLDLAKEHDIPYIFPVTESSLVPLNEFRSEVEKVSKLIAPSSLTILNALDKKLALATAEQQGVPISRTHYPDSIKEAADFAEEVGYPVILKPRGRANDSRIGGSFDFKYLYIHNRAQLEQSLSSCKPGAYPMMQDFSFGGHTQFNCFMENGKGHSFFQDDAVRMLPLTGGVGTSMRSRSVVPELAEYTQSIFRAMNWEGCGQAQFKGPGKDGKYKFIEVSVRLPASVGSAVYSGVDTPWMQYCYFTGRPVTPVSHYTIGQRTRWLRGDTLTVAQYLLGETPEPIDPLPSRISVALAWFMDFFRPSLKHYVESFQDPLPGVYEFIHSLGDIAKAMKGRVRRMLGR